jgi:hypothetical protein
MNPEGSGSRETAQLTRNQILHSRRVWQFWLRRTSRRKPPFRSYEGRGASAASP